MAVKMLYHENTTSRILNFNAFLMKICNITISWIMIKINIDLTCY